MLPPLSDEQWPESIGSMSGSFATRLNVYRVMAHHPELLRSWADFRNHVVLDTALGPENSEIVILRTGMHLGSAYEWAHHVSRARKLGMADARILATSGDISAMESQDALLARAVDQLFVHKQILPRTQKVLVQKVGSEAMLDLMATVAHYSLLGFMLNSFEVELDHDVAQEKPLTPEGPFVIAAEDLE